MGVACCCFSFYYRCYPTFSADVSFSVMTVIQILTYGLMYQVLPRRVAHINNSIIISSVAKFMIWKLTLESVLVKSRAT